MYPLILESKFNNPLFYSDAIMKLNDANKLLEEKVTKLSTVVEKTVAQIRDAPIYGAGSL